MNDTTGTTPATVGATVLDKMVEELSEAKLLGMNNEKFQEALKKCDSAELEAALATLQDIKSGVMDRVSWLAQLVRTRKYEEGRRAQREQRRAGQGLPASRVTPAVSTSVSPTKTSDTTRKRPHAGKRKPGPRTRPEDDGDEPETLFGDPDAILDSLLQAPPSGSRLAQLRRR